MRNLDLHGKNRFEAQILIDGFLYENYCLKEYFVCIIHGHGNHVMTNVVYQALSTSPYVDHYEFAPPQYGGSGATIVYLKQGEV